MTEATVTELRQTLTRLLNEPYTNGKYWILRIKARKMEGSDEE